MAHYLEMIRDCEVIGKERWWHRVEIWKIRLDKPNHSGGSICKYQLLLFKHDMKLVSKRVDSLTLWVSLSRNIADMQLNTPTTNDTYGYLHWYGTIYRNIADMQLNTPTTNDTYRYVHWYGTIYRNIADMQLTIPFQIIRPIRMHALPARLADSPKFATCACGHHYHKTIVRYIYVCMYLYMYVCVCVCMYIYIYMRVLIYVSM